MRRHVREAQLASWHGRAEDVGVGSIVEAFEICEVSFGIQELRLGHGAETIIDVHGGHGSPGSGPGGRCVHGGHVRSSTLIAAEVLLGGRIRLGRRRNGSAAHERAG